MRAVGQLAGRIGPCSAAVGGRRPEQRRAVIYLHRAVGRRRSGESWCVVVGDPVAHRSTVGRERSDGRGTTGRLGVDRYGKRR